MKAIALLFCTLSLSLFSGIKQKGRIFNMQGPEAAAWDLSNNSAQYIYDSNEHKDLINTTSRQDKLPFFRREVRSGNGSVFIKLPKKKAPAHHYSALKEFYKNSKNSDKIQHIKKHDQYLVVSKNSETLFILTITHIQDDFTSRLFGGNNLDCIQFEYEPIPYLAPEALRWNSSDNQENFKEPSVVIFPNPIVSDVFISFQNFEQNNWKVKIENTKGEIVYESLEAIQKQQWNKDVSGFPKGRYIITLLKDEEVYLQKVVDKANSAISSREDEAE
jgi:hypothetical protein